MLSKTAVGIAAAGAGLCFLGYCIYFDQKRRGDPNFKQKLRERRRNAKKRQKPGNSPLQFPNMADTEAVQRFFLQEVQMGEDLLAKGNIEGGVEHLSAAVAVCGQPQQLLQVLQQTLPPQVFQLLALKLPDTEQRMKESSTPATLLEDDLE